LKYPAWPDKNIKVRRTSYALLRISGKNLTEKAVAQAIQLSEEKYCSVAATIRATAQITTDFEIIEDAVPELVVQA